MEIDDLGGMEMPSKPFVGIHPYWDCAGCASSLRRIAKLKSNFIMRRKLQYTKIYNMATSRREPEPSGVTYVAPALSTRRRRTTTAHRAPRHAESC